MSQALLPLYDRDITLVRGKGSTLWTSDDRRFLDFCAGIAVNGLGYGDRSVVKAIRDQAGKLMHISNLYHSEPASRLAQRLVALAFPSKVFFSNSAERSNSIAVRHSTHTGSAERYAITKRAPLITSVIAAIVPRYSIVGRRLQNLRTDSGVETRRAIAHSSTGRPLSIK